MRRVTGMLLRSLIAGLVLGAAGCSDDPAKPGTVPTTSPAVTTSSPVPTQTPVDQQVEAAVRAYYAELTHAAQTNDTSLLKQMLAKSCPCYRAVRVIDGNRRRGESTPHARFSLRFLKVHDIAGQSASVECRTRDSGYDVLNRAGEVIDHIKAANTHLDLALLRNTVGRWIVTNSFDLEAGS